ncbi:probable methyltransferase-like protein 24 [Hemitrygon akajei]|uniref:probable methyltransferase-like protein 24 n=1 Tax=Hemitrygon akajei TaxID=2704970 RepID=UPI003BFA1EE5
MYRRRLRLPLPLGLCSVALVLLLLGGFRGSWCPRNPPLSREEALPSAGAGVAGRSEIATGRVTYVRSLKRDGPAARARDAEGLGPDCCPSPLLQGKRKSLRWHIELQPWVSPRHSLEEEAARFLAYISHSQVPCTKVDGTVLIGSSEKTQEPWAVCLDDTFHLARQIHAGKCRIYSVGLGSGDKHFEEEMAGAGCEVHYFDPSVREAHVQKSKGYWHHRISINWRDPNPAMAAQQQPTTTKKLGVIMDQFGHRKIDVLKADLESAEWKILENLILENVIEEIGQLVFAIHLHWPGFEVSGGDNDVVRYWYSLLKELELTGFKLFRSYKNVNKPQIFLQKQVFNASSSYVLSWVNTRWGQH